MLMRARYIPVVSAAMLALWVVCGPARGQERAPSRSAELAKFVEMLGSREFQEREKASKALAASEDSIPHLVRALRHSDAEIAKRSRAILLEFTKRALPRYLEYARHGRIDLLVEWFCVWEAVDVEACWQGINDIAFELLKRSGIREVRPNVRWDLPVNYSKYGPTLGDPERFLFNTDGTGWPTFKVRARGTRPIAAKVLGLGMVTSCGSVKLQLGSASSIILANDDVSFGTTEESIIVSDGSISGRQCLDSLLIARKNIAVRGTASRECYSHLHAGGDAHIELLNADQSVMQPATKVKAFLTGTEIKQNQRVPLGVRFFETADVGIEVAAVAKGIKVEKLSPDFPPAKAGLTVGDIILEVDDKKLVDPEVCRRQLRRAYVQGEAVFKVQRGNKQLELTVTFAGFDLPKAK